MLRDADANELSQWRSWACVWLAASGVLFPADIDDETIRMKMDELITALAARKECDCE